jgi:hypothetical protein
LYEYIRAYPEERDKATSLILSWKTATSEVYHLYKDIFKLHVRTMQQAPPKYKPLLHELHQVYKATLQPLRRSVAWEDCKTFMNQRDVPQILYVLNWDRRTANSATQRSSSAPAILSSATATTAATTAAVAAAAATVTGESNVVVLATSEEDYSDMPPLVPVSALLPPPPPDVAIARVESGPVS